MTRTKKLDELVSSVEDLLAQLPNDLTPGIAELRDKVDAGIFDAWTSVAREVTEARAAAELRARGRLFGTVGVALLAGVAGLVGYHITRQSPR